MPRNLASWSPMNAPPPLPWRFRIPTIGQPDLEPNNSCNPCGNSISLNSGSMATIISRWTMRLMEPGLSASQSWRLKIYRADSEPYCFPLHFVEGSNKCSQQKPKEKPDDSITWRYPYRPHYCHR